ncbi:MAG TPA: ABC transporter substrate-binding protein, partial [Chloroflexota bacterium]
MAPIRLGVVGGTGRLHQSPTLVAVGQGHFARQGLDVEVSDYSGGDAGVKLLGADKLDVAAVGPGLFFYKEWSPERPMVMVADQGQLGPGRGGGAIVARKSLVDSGELSDFASLRGQRVGLCSQRGNHDWLTLAAALRLGGLTFDDIEIVISDFGEQRHRHLLDGCVDVSTVGRPSSLVEGREAGAFVVWKWANEAQPGRQQFAVTFSHQFWTERPAEAQRYVVGYLQGLRAYYDAFEHGHNKDAAIDALARESDYDRDVIANEMVPA